MSMELVPFRKPRLPDIYDRSADPVLIRQTVVESGRGQHDLVIRAEHEKSHGPHAKEDIWAEYDVWVASRMMSILLAEYPGHPWRTRHDSVQGIAGVANWVLMGMNKWLVINLKTDDLTPQLVIRAGGEILERYRLPRGRLELGSFLDARAKHSALVVKSRKVPD